MQVFHLFDAAPYPNHLHLQLDNGPDNKSRWVFAYMADIIRRGIFLTGHISFMKAGHTHCNIDQNFSSVNKAFSYVSVKTIQEFNRILSTALPELKTRKVRVDFVHDLKSFYDQYLKNDISGQFFPHQFRYWITAIGFGYQARMWFYNAWYTGRKLVDAAVSSSTS